MTEIRIHRITPEQKADINIKNESFPLFGRMLPSYTNGEWDYTTELLDTPAEDLFPDENYDFDKMEKTHLFIGAYQDETCIGLAILEKQWHKYLYLSDLKINKAFRRQGVASRLLQEAGDTARCDSLAAVISEAAVKIEDKLIPAQWYMISGNTEKARETLAILINGCISLEDIQLIEQSFFNSCRPGEDHQFIIDRINSKKRFLTKKAQINKSTR